MHINTGWKLHSGTSKGAGNSKLLISSPNEHISAGALIEFGRRENSFKFQVLVE